MYIALALVALIVLALIVSSFISMIFKLLVFAFALGVSNYILCNKLKWLPAIKLNAFVLEKLSRLKK